MPIKLKKSDIKDKLDNPKAGYMILGFDEKGELVWKDEDGNYGSIVPSATVGNYDVLQVKQYLTVGYRLVGVNTGLYSIAHGSDVAASGESSYAQGMDAEADGLYSTAKGINVIASGDYAYVNGVGQLSLNKLESGGVNSFVHSFADTSNPSGTWSDYSVILGGTNHFIATGADNSVILGGRNHGIDMDVINSAIIGGIGNSINSSLENVAVIACNGVIAPMSDAVYMPRIVLSGGTGLSSPIPGTIEYDSITDNFLSYTMHFPGGTALGGVYQSTLTPLSMTVKPGGVGGISDTTTLGSLTGKTYTYLFDSLLFPDVLAYVGTTNSANVTGYNGTTPVEVGTSYGPTVTANYIRGTIYDGSGTLNINPLTGNPINYTFYYNATLDNTYTTTNTSQINPYTTRTIVLAANTWSSVINYSAGSGTYYDNKGNLGSNLAAQRASGTRTGTSTTVNGWRYAWYGSGGAGSSPTDGTAVRARVISSTWNKVFLTNTSYTGTFTITIPAGSFEIYFYTPAGRTISSIQYQESAYADVKGSFTETAFPVADAAGSTTVSYSQYKSTITGYGSTAHYIVTIV